MLDIDTIQFEKNNSESVDYALRLMCAHLRDLPDKIKKDKAFGVLMAGWHKQSVSKILIFTYAPWPY